MSGRARRLHRWLDSADPAGLASFTAGLRAKKDSVSFSPLDLIIENGTIEHPFKPMTCIGTPVFDSAGHKRGLIVLN